MIALPRIAIDRDSLGTFEEGARREWLVTNGIGGYASGTVQGVNTRRYHGLLVAALRPPLGRTVMVARLDVAAHYGGEEVPLATSEFGDGTIAPHGYRQLQSFRLEGQTPVWTWLIADALLEQRLWMEHGENTTFIEWRLLQASAPVQLDVRPLCTWRDYHWQHRGRRDPRLRFAAGSVEFEAFDGTGACRLSADSGEWLQAGEWYWNFRHREEAARGLEQGEDLFCPARLRLTLCAGESRSLTLSAEAHEPTPAAASLQRHRERQLGLLQQFSAAGKSAAGDWKADAAPLVLAADQFIVTRREPDGRPAGRSVIAGYPWFSDWGRDTMIALPGLALTTGRQREAAEILRTFAQYISQGMLPNRFPDAGEAPEYNTVDATLWYFVAVHEHLRRTADAALRRDLVPVLRDIVEWHLRGTRYGIRMDAPDALLQAGVPGVQLTWMDARVGDQVITPRIGKPVEINALWINALHILAGLCAAEGDSRAAEGYASLAGRAAESFTARFWNEAAGHLNDVIDTPQGPVDASLRPNQIFALSLPFVLLDQRRGRAVVDTCLRELWTPMGLRSLAPRNRAYTGHYRGGPAERDAAYHQGTVWSWLLGPFALAHLRMYGDHARARQLLAGLFAHLRESCVGQISEIFEGDAPFAPAGCFAQAWSVAETLRAWSEIHECQSAPR